MYSLEQYRIPLIRMVQAVLRAPGNFTGPMLEMAVVIDSALPALAAKELCRELCLYLKNSSEVFRRVRLNTILWRSDDCMVKELTALSCLGSGLYFNAYKSLEEEKHVELLLEQLKKFYARSKLIIALSSGHFVMGSQEAAGEQLKPFLGRKLIWILTGRPMLAKDQEQALFLPPGRVIRLYESGGGGMR